MTEVFIHHEASQERIIKARMRVFAVFHLKIQNSMAMSKVGEQMLYSLLLILGTRNSNTRQVSHTHEFYDVFISGRTNNPSPSGGGYSFWNTLE